MQFASVRIITADVDRLVAFYERLLGVAGERLHPLFAEFRSPSGTLAIGSDQTVPVFGAGSAEAGANRSAILEFRVDDVDAAFAALQEWVPEFVLTPTTLPWGNRAVLLRDPDGNLVNLFTPTTPEAVARFGA